MAFLNKEGLERLWQHIVLGLGDKVDKVEGKDLSTEDYTTEEKEKLASVEDMIADAIAASGGGGGQAEFATVSSEDWGKNLTTEGRLHLNADTIMVNNVTFTPDTNMPYLSTIGGVAMDTSGYPYCAVNRQYVDEAIAALGGGSGSGGGQAEFATVTEFNGGKTLTAEGRLHINASAIMLNDITVTPKNDGTYLSIIGGFGMDSSGYPYCAVNREYVDNAIDSLRTELKAYIDEAILGGKW